MIARIVGVYNVDEARLSRRLCQDMFYIGERTATVSPVRMKRGP